MYGWGTNLSSDRKRALRKDMPSSAIMEEVAGVRAAVVKVAAALEAAVEAGAEADGQAPAARS